MKNLDRNKIKKMIIESVMIQLFESNYLIGNDFEELIQELKRIIHEIGINNAFDARDIKSHHHYGNMEAITPYFGYKQGDAALLKVIVDLERYLVSTVIPWDTINAYNRDILKQELLEAFPNSFFSGNIFIVNGEDTASDRDSFYRKGAREVPWWRGPYGIFK